MKKENTTIHHIRIHIAISPIVQFYFALYFGLCEKNSRNFHIVRVRSFGDKTHNVVYKYCYAVVDIQSHRMNEKKT